MAEPIVVILGGGRGQRLFPLTQHRSKPAVPIAGKYRLIDIPISNCLNSGLQRIFVLTQASSESLNRHLSLTYKFDMFSAGFVSVLAAEQTDANPEWFQGPADAVRRSIRYLNDHRHREVVVLAGDQIYQLDFRRMIETHRRHVADATVAVVPVSQEQASGFTIAKVNRQGRIIELVEKPEPNQVASLVSDLPNLGSVLLAAMGIYVFGCEALAKSLADPSLVEFREHVIPAAVPRLRVHAHVYRGYWQDVGNIRSYYHANLALCQPVPPFDFYEASRPVYTHPRPLPATKVEACTLREALIAEGSILVQSEIEQSVIGIRSRIGRNTRISESLILGADFYETLDEIEHSTVSGIPPVGIGSDSRVHRAIVDKNARIGRGVQIVNQDGQTHRDGDGYFIREGIVVVPKNGVIRDGTTI